MRPQMLSGYLQGQFLAFFSRMKKPSRILEIGTYTGYSAICLAQGLVENGILHTIDINKELELERVFLNWLRISKDELQDQIDAYEVYARVIANTALYPGVTIKLNRTTWEAKKEYRHCRIGLEEGKWLYAALI